MDILLLKIQAWLNLQRSVKKLVFHSFFMTRRKIFYGSIFFNLGSRRQIEFSRGILEEFLRSLYFKVTLWHTTKSCLWVAFAQFCQQKLVEIRLFSRFSAEFFHHLFLHNSRIDSFLFANLFRNWSANLFGTFLLKISASSRQHFFGFLGISVHIMPSQKSQRIFGTSFFTHNGLILNRVTHLFRNEAAFFFRKYFIYLEKINKNLLVFYVSVKGTTTSNCFDISIPIFEHFKTVFNKTEKMFNL